jgi:hypothetical protein
MSGTALDNPDPINRSSNVRLALYSRTSQHGDAWWDRVPPARRPMTGV